MNPLAALSGGGRATWFLAPSDPVAARKRWIAGTLEPKGAIIIDDGAAGALEAGKSLLPAGVRRVEGAFERGDAVVIRTLAGRDLGRGLVAYGSEETGRIIGKKSKEIAEILGFEGRAELIHRDDMALGR
jgi:glutamate 5-kinase